MADKALYLVAMAAGFLLLAAVVWLLKSRAIYIDRETKQAVEFEFPVFGKVKSQNPVLVLVLIAAGLVIYPLKLWNDSAQEARNPAIEEAGVVTGEVDAQEPVTVAIQAVPRFQETLQASGPFTITVPIIKNTSYRAWFVTNRRIFQDREFTFSDSKAPLGKVVHSEQDETPTSPPLSPQKEIPDAELRTLGIR